jgi:hypothetical protein
MMRMTQKTRPRTLIMIRDLHPMIRTPTPMPARTFSSSTNKLEMVNSSSMRHNSCMLMIKKLILTIVIPAIAALPQTPKAKMFKLKRTLR